MAEYIEREAAIKAVCTGCSPQICLLDCDIVTAIKAIPAADVRPVKRGKWIKYAPHNSDMMTCSECEKYWILDGDQYDYHFCPNCGADMKED